MNGISMQRLALRSLVALAAAAALAACEGALNVDRPGQITEPQVTGGELNDALVAAAEGEFHVAFNWVANSGAAASDEAIFAHGWSPWEDYDERDITPASPAWDGIGYPWMQRARVTGVRSVRQLEAAKAPAIQIATALNYAGFSTLLLADYQCEVTFAGGPAVSRAVAYDSAISLFQRAVTLAAGNPQMLDMANVGMARAYLAKKDLNNAIVFAAKVAPSFEVWVKFVDSNNFGDWVDKYNLYYRTSGFISPAEFSLGLDPAEWTGKTDRRVPYNTAVQQRMFTSNPYPRSAFIPYVPYSFSRWTTEDTITGGNNIRFASGLEAQYIIAEASLYGGTGGWTSAQVQSFINARRAVGGHGPYGGADLKAELREQRKMDFFFAGYRMPDLIRYKANYGVDLWPKGKVGGYPANAPYMYGSTECWPIAQSEISTNPNL
ncbi:MAG TPA: RagB/SusD family nutrient uptake outer membrane protein [Longimicrobium sp.]